MEEGIHDMNLAQARQCQQWQKDCMYEDSSNSGSTHVEIWLEEK